MLLRIGFLAPQIVRVTCTATDRSFLDRPNRIIIADRSWIAFDLHEEAGAFTLRTSAITVRVDRRTGSLTYLRADGGELIREPARGGRWLTPKDVYRNVFRKDAVIEYSSSIDGARARPSQFETVLDRIAFEAKLEFEFSPDEAIFGFGSHEEGYGNLRGRSRELYQQNMKAVVPAFVSTHGYAMLFDCASLMTFHDDSLGSYWWADTVDELDFYLLAGDTFDDLTRANYQLTGAPPLLPRWAFGYFQSKERYVNAQEMLDVVREYRRRHIPLDVIVLDWKSWPTPGGWGQKSFDPIRFPSPLDFVSELHGMGARLMVSIWPIMTGGCANQRELLERGLMLGNQSTYDAFQADARECYWQQAQRGLFDHGVDAWWCDCTEPFEADWSGAVKPEPHVRLALNTSKSKHYLDPAEINAYSLVHSQGIYEGQRRTGDAKRVVNLTRSSYAGQHRYATITWNGDICATWEALRRCIPEGLNFCVTGEPYWTVDAGGFFVANNSSLWFWRGDYNNNCRGLTPADALMPDPGDTGCRDLGFSELYIRWMQYAAFLPVFRSHGTDAAREIWRFGDEGSPFYDALARCLRLRYQLLPYIYSLAAGITFRGSAMLRTIALDFPQDPATHNLTDQYLFGPSILVCPVTHPMYFTAGSKPIADATKSRLVYLPRGKKWYDFWTDALHAGGQQLAASAPLDTIPLFICAGSILPLSVPMQFTDEIPNAPIELRVYAGANARFTLYDDDGDGYGYERGEYALVEMEWLESTRELVLHGRRGSFPQMLPEREFNILILSASGRTQHRLTYTGSEHRLTVHVASLAAPTEEML
jgi:alpha-D-xyloside xylohydrolase